jgi:DNA-binding SARP family transcriptional activator
MYQQSTNPARLYLPLLTHPQPMVRQHACLILLGTYGDRALTYLRRLLDEADPQLRQDARLALLALVEMIDGMVKLQSFRGMHVECLGHMRVYIGNHALQTADWAEAGGGRAGWQKVAGVLAYLVHCGRRGASREALGAAVWGGAFSASSLARTLSTLRQAFRKYAGSAPAIEGALVLESDHCLLDPDCYHSDVQLFEQAFSLATQIEQDRGLEHAVPIYTHALQLYTGPYMAGVARADGWCRQRRDHLMSSFMIAAERLAEQAYGQQQYQRCIDACTLALDADPAADEVMIWLLRAFTALDRPAEREHAYRGYLHAIGLDLQRLESEQDPVVRAYRELVKTKALGE